MAVQVRSVDILVQATQTNLIASGNQSNIIILAASAYNSSGSQGSVSIWRLPSGGSASAGNRLFDAATTKINSKVTLPLLALRGQTLSNGQKLVATASNGAVTLSIGFVGDPL